MTVLGAVIGANRALLWADTEYFRDGAACGDMPKIVINPLGFASVGGGSVAIGHEQSAVTLSALSVDDIERQMPGRLRTRAVQLAPRLTRKMEGWLFGSCILAVGHSPTAGRVVGWRLDGRNLFEPVLETRFAAPSDASIDADMSGLWTQAHVIAVARRQLALLRLRGLPDATGGTLTIAEITPRSVSCWSIPDFDISAGIVAHVNGGH